MPDDPVAEALRVAVDAVWIGVQPGEREYQDAARIVSGFLSHFPSDMDLTRWDTQRGRLIRIKAEGLHELAAAVERAAEGER